MKKLKVNNEYLTNENNKILEFEKIIKTNDSIICFSNGVEYCRFRGVKDFSVFKLEDGYEFDTLEDELQQEINAKLLKDSANLQIELNKQRELNADLLLKIAESGGNVNA